MTLVAYLRSIALQGDRHAGSFAPHGRRTRALDVYGYDVDYRIRRVA
jgi:hypothetical protein